MRDPLESLKSLKYQPQPGRWEALAKKKRRWPMGVLAAAAVALMTWAAVVMRSPSLPMSLSNGAQLTLTTRGFETSASETAVVTLGDIGTVTLQPETRARVVKTDNGLFRLALEAGEMHAAVNAPPRIFVVETPQTTAVDLGCTYSLKVENGVTVLNVEVGLVELGNVTVLQGSSARVGADGRASTPIANDASDAFRDLVKRADAGDAGALLQAFDLARAEDAATLWHLLTRVPEDARASAGLKLAALVKAPKAWAPGNMEPLVMQQWWGEIVRETGRRDDAH